MQRKAHYRQSVKGPFNEAQARSDLARIGTDDLWDMLETNLSRLSLGIEGGARSRELDHRARLSLAIAREVRLRGVQLRIQF